MIVSIAHTIGLFSLPLHLKSLTIIFLTEPWLHRRMLLVSGRAALDGRER